MDISPYIDHTLLKADATATQISELCAEAAQERFAAVCVPPCHVRPAKDLLRGTSVAVCTVIGFPFGYNTTDIKLAEALDAVKNGADELDIVHNLSALRSGSIQYLENEIAACLRTVRLAGKKLKVIIESGILTNDEIVRCCELYGRLGVDFVKTSTGYAEKGASTQAVKLMRENLPDNIRIKASGGIRNFAFAKELIGAGADRIGCSASMQIINESKAVYE